jgi:hypothetical protein
MFRPLQLLATPAINIKYYFVILDGYSHFCWTFTMKSKSEVYSIFTNFHAYVLTQFNRPIKLFQADNGTDRVR